MYTAYNMICVIFTSKLEIPEDGNDVLHDVRRLWLLTMLFPKLLLPEFFWILEVNVRT